jgi:hypothetical protein
MSPSPGDFLSHTLSGERERDRSDHKVVDEDMGFPVLNSRDLGIIQRR